MPTAPIALPATKLKDKFGVEKATSGGISLLTLEGTLNEAFEGRKIAESLRTKKLVVNMREVRRYASWGMSEWMDFLRINAERDVYLVECSTYAVSQINLITGLLGHCKLTSFYASYRCTACSQEIETQFVIPRDRATIRELQHGSSQVCPTCGGRASLEEYPAAFFETMAGRPSFDIDDEVLAYFNAQLRYELVPDLTRFRAYRAVQNGYTYLRLSGSTTLLPAELLANASEGTTVVDLAGIVFDPADIRQWKSYLAAAQAKAKSLQLLNCPLGFLETAIAPDDLRGNLKVRTFALSYDCLRCDTAIPYMVDVAENLEHLVAGAVPPAQCPACQSALVAALTADQITHLRALPARDRDPALDKFLSKARGEPVEKLENCLIAQPPQPPKAPGANRAMYVAVGLGALLVGGFAALAFGPLSKSRDANAKVTEAMVVPQQPPQPTFTRPEWIISDVPSSAYCHEMINRVMCIGVSGYRATRDDAVAEANDAALEELVSAIGLKITDPFFRESVIPELSAVRSKALSALSAADVDRSSKAYAAAADAVRKARKRVAEILQASGGAAVPTQRSDWYWEEYAGEKGKPNEVLVFVRYDVTLDAMRALVERYSATTQVLGSAAMTAFPGVAWQYADFAGGARLTKVSRRLASAGVTPQHMVLAVEDQRISDASSLAKRVEEVAKGSSKLSLTVKSGSEPEQVVKVDR